ncbi:MAG: peptide-methionine (S)-S-oxide reductase MsrA [Spirochaetaceae bacterium]
MAEAARMETATLGGGCFWCIEAVYRRVEGVESAKSGYAGGQVPNPSYEAVCTGQTGHAEVVEVAFDPSIVSYESILDIFFQAHDPTTKNRQGADVGPQYRSVIFYHSDEQKRTAERTVKAVSQTLGKPVVTEIEPATEFYPAEQYHDQYFDRNPNAGYCRVVIHPKLRKLGMI